MRRGIVVSMLILAGCDRAPASATPVALSEQEEVARKFKAAEEAFEKAEQHPVYREFLSLRTRYGMVAGVLEQFEPPDLHRPVKKRLEEAGALLDAMMRENRGTPVDLEGYAVRLVQIRQDVAAAEDRYKALEAGSVFCDAMVGRTIHHGCGGAVAFGDACKACGVQGAPGYSCCSRSQPVREAVCGKCGRRSTRTPILMTACR